MATRVLTGPWLTGVALCATFAFTAPQMAEARDWAIVVGIDDYIHFQPFDPVNPVFGVHTDLQGAANDAKVVAAALRKAGVDLPDQRFLLDQNATLANFERSWAEVVASAAAGDRVFVTYAGHGGQETEVSEPFDEKDGMDETLMFADFDPNNPRIGRLNDDQIRDMLEKVPQLQIVNAAFALSKALLPALQAAPNASVIFTSSSVGRKGRAYWGAYSVSKFATEALMQVLADELRQTSRVRVNSIDPGGTRTNMRKEAYPAEDPLQLPTPEDRMPLYLYLMSEASAAVTGEALTA